MQNGSFKQSHINWKMHLNGFRKKTINIYGTKVKIKKKKKQPGHVLFVIINLFITIDDDKEEEEEEKIVSTEIHI